MSAGVPSESNSTVFGDSNVTVIYEGPGTQIFYNSDGGSAHGISGLSTTVPDFYPYRIGILMQSLSFGGGSAHGTIGHAMCAGWTDGTKYQFIQLTDIANSSTQLSVVNYSNYYTANSTVYSSYFGYNPDTIWFGVRDDGTNVYWEISRDGVNFWTVYITAKSSGYLSDYSKAFWGVVDDSNTTWSSTLRCWNPNTWASGAFPTGA